LPDDKPDLYLEDIKNSYEKLYKDVEADKKNGAAIYTTGGLDNYVPNSLPKSKTKKNILQNLSKINIIKLACSICLLILLTACTNTGDKVNIELYAYGYYDAIDINTKLPSRDSQDTMLYFCSQCKLNEFDKALEVFPSPDNYNIIGGWNYSSKNLKISHGANNFPFDSFSSEQIVMHAMYFQRKYDCHTRVLDVFYRKALELDSNNVIALYELSRIGVLAKEYNRTLCLLNRLLTLVPNWENALDMKDFVIGGINNRSMKFKKENSVSEVIKNTMHSYGIDYGNYNRFE